MIMEGFLGRLRQEQACVSEELSESWAMGLRVPDCLGVVWSFKGVGFVLSEMGDEN